MMASQPKISVLVSLYKAEKYLEKFIEEIQKQSMFPECEFVFVLNEASELEKYQVEKIRKIFPDQFQVIFVESVESLGASWNRGWQAANAPYVAMWNVDDRRNPGSLLAQYETLEAQAEWQLCYGDYVRVKEYSREEGELRRTPEFSEQQFRRAFPQGGAFWLMRKTALEKIGFFDEQFQVGPDMDLAIRMAEAGYKMGRVDQILGTFTDAEEGLSTREGGQESAIERTAIQLRYGIFDKLRTEYVSDAMSYRIDEVLSFGEWHSLDLYLPDRKRGLKRKWPLWLLGTLRNGIRKILKALGLLDLIYSIQKRFIGREI